MTDLPTRLRSAHLTPQDIDDAADEIERLRARVAKLEEIEKKQTARIAELEAVARSRTPVLSNTGCETTDEPDEGLTRAVLAMDDTPKEPKQ